MSVKSLFRNQTNQLLNSSVMLLYFQITRLFLRQKGPIQWNNVMFCILFVCVQCCWECWTSERVTRSSRLRLRGDWHCCWAMRWGQVVALREQQVWETTVCRFVNHLCYVALFYSCFLCMSSLDSFIELFLCACLMPLWILNQSLSLWHIPTPALPPRIIIQGQGVSMATLSYSSLACRATQKNNHFTPVGCRRVLLQLQSQINY